LKDKNIPIIQLTDFKNISVIFTAIDSPIYRAKLWINPYQKHLPFMANEDTEYNYYSVSLQNIIIDYEEYLQVTSYIVLRQKAGTWMVDPSDKSRIFIHFVNSNPPFTVLSFKSGVLYGFSYGDSVTLNELKTYPTILDLSTVDDTADNFVYKKMEFSTGSVTIDNSTGILDELTELFGNDLLLQLYMANKQLNIIRQFFIESYTIGLNKAVFSVKDKRSRLTFKAPNTFYTLEEYPFIEDNLVDKVIQDAYGYCKGVAGTCINRLQVYNPPSYSIDSGFNDWFKFKFARMITNIDEVWVEMSDKWIQVFPGLGIPENHDKNDFVNIYKDTNPYMIRLLTKDEYGRFTKPYQLKITDQKQQLPENNGVIEIWWSQAMKDNPGHLEKRNGSANKVKMNGVFVNLETPGDIAKDLMTYYGNLKPESYYFDLQEWENEMEDGREIGLCLDTADDVFSLIEKIQNGVVLGFQLMVNKNLFTVRVDNPNRSESFNIQWSEILNRNEIELELNGENYATFTTINYSKDYTDNKYLTTVDKSERNEILEKYQFDKEYQNDSLLKEEFDVYQKGKIILENFKNIHPIFRNIELDGFHWDSIKLFSTGFIDFTFNMPRQMKIIQKYMKERNFMGKLRVKVIGIRRDLKLEKIWIDVIQCDILESLKIVVDLDGGFSNTEGYIYEVDNLSARLDKCTVPYDFNFIFDGGGA